MRIRKCRRVTKQQRLEHELERVRQRLSRQAVLLRSGLGAARIEPLLQAEGLGRVIHNDITCACDSSSVSCATCVQQVATPERQIWATVQAMQAVAQYAGAPLAWGCDSLATALNELLLLRKRRRVLLAGPKTSVTMIALLPLLAIGLGHLIGFNPTAVLLGQLGPLFLITGGFFLVIGTWWIRKLVAAAESAEQLIGFECELLVLALRGGLPLQRAARLVADEISNARCQWLSTDELAAKGDAGQAAQLLATTGAGMTQLLLETAARKRRIAAESLEASAEKLGTRVLLPLGICILPAFVILGVIPVVISMFTGL